MEDNDIKKIAEDAASALLKETAVDTAKDLKINTLEINFKLMMEQNAKEHLETKNTLVSIEKSLKEMVDKMDAKYAGKWTEKVITFVGMAVGGTFLAYIGTLIYQATVNFSK